MKILHYLKNIYVQIFILSILILAIYYPILMGIYAKVSTNEDYSHAFLMPFIAAYLIWEKRKSFKNAQIRPFWIGILLVDRHFISDFHPFVFYLWSFRFRYICC